MVVCAGRGEEFSFAQVIGVGLVESAINLTRICLTQKVDEIIFVGSAGAYDKRVRVLDVFCATQATQIESASLTHNAYTPITPRIESPKPVFCNVSYETMLVNSSNYITTDSVVARKFVEQGLGLENMEFFAVVEVARHFGIGCLGIFCVSNHCDSNAHREFLRNREAVRERIESLAPMLAHQSTRLAQTQNLRLVDE